MKKHHEPGDLVHIPQATRLLDCRGNRRDDPQLTIPTRVVRTDSPKVGVVTEPSVIEGYVRVYCDGDLWAVKSDGLYPLNKKE